MEAWYEHLSDVITKITKTDQPCLYIVYIHWMHYLIGLKRTKLSMGLYGAAKPNYGELFRRFVRMDGIHVCI